MNNVTLTPLRYPGGKSIFTNFFAAYIEANKIKQPIYAEPYCGGAGAAINLLLSNKVSEIHLNDANYSIYSFWKSLVKYGDDFLESVATVEVSLRQWRKQKEIFIASTNKSLKKADILANGFATFYLNRCNRSGILTAGPIGGLTKEKQLLASYKIDARFNKENLIDKLQAIISKKKFIHVYNEDATKFLSYISEELPNELQQRFFVYLDPPYYIQGASLYMNYYEHEDHVKIANLLKVEKKWRWLLSYDNVNPIKKLYKEFPQYSFYLNYSAHQSKLGNELLIHSNNSLLPDSLVIKKVKKTKKVISLVEV